MGGDLPGTATGKICPASRAPDRVRRDQHLNQHLHPPSAEGSMQVLRAHLQKMRGWVIGMPRIRAFRSSPPLER
jgi:hypothetical protein